MGKVGRLSRERGVKDLPPDCQRPHLFAHWADRNTPEGSIRLSTRTVSDPPVPASAKGADPHSSGTPVVGNAMIAHEGTYRRAPYCGRRRRESPGEVANRDSADVGTTPRESSDRALNKGSLQAREGIALAQTKRYPTRLETAAAPGRALVPNSLSSLGRPTPHYTHRGSHPARIPA